MNWANLIMALVSPIARRVLVSLGIGIITYTGVSLAVNGLLDAARAAWSSGPGAQFGAAAQLIALSGANVGLGIIAGAIVGRIAMVVFKKFAILS